MNERQKIERSHQVQAKGLQKRGGESTDQVHQAAEAGLSGGGGAMPFADRIQESFGSFDVSGIRAHTGGAAQKANEKMGSMAYATGNNVAFRGAPDLFTAAHEAAHVIQQQAGVQLRGGVGEAGDRYEQHADAVASRVVQGRSAEDLLTQFTGGGASVQRRKGVQPRAIQQRASDRDAVQMNVDPVSGTIAAAAFALQVAPNTAAGLAQSNVIARYVRDGSDASSANARRVNLDVLRLWGHVAAGSSDAKFKLVLHTDGDNIFAANTEMTERNGFDGGAFGSTASVNWNASAYSGPRDRPTSILLTCSGHLDPSGWSYCDYNFSLLVKGDGTVVRQGGRVMNVSGNIPYTMAIEPHSSGYKVTNMSRDRAENNQSHPAEDGR